MASSLLASSFYHLELRFRDGLWGLQNQADLSRQNEVSTINDSSVYYRATWRTCILAQGLGLAEGQAQK